MRDVKNSGERQYDNQRAQARRIRARSGSRRAMRGWPLFRRGLAVFAVGAIITVLTFIGARSHGGFYLVSLGSLIYGLVDMARGLGSLKSARQLEALQAPLSERQPWLFAAAPFGMNPDGSPSAPEPGWHPDPLNPAVQRWYDGQNWTQDTRGMAAQA
jgi:hypothetical protein